MPPQRAPRSCLLVALLGVPQVHVARCAALPVQRFDSTSFIQAEVLVQAHDPTTVDPRQLLLMNLRSQVHSASSSGAEKAEAEAEVNDAQAFLPATVTQKPVPNTMNNLPGSPMLDMSGLADTVDDYGVSIRTFRTEASWKELMRFTVEENSTIHRTKAAVSSGLTDLRTEVAGGKAKDALEVKRVLAVAALLLDEEMGALGGRVGAAKQSVDALFPRSLDWRKVVDTQVVEKGLASAMDDLRPALKKYAQGRSLDGKDYCPTMQKLMKRIRKLGTDLAPVERVQADLARRTDKLEMSRIVLYAPDAFPRMQAFVLHQKALALSVTRAFMSSLQEVDSFLSSNLRSTGCAGAPAVRSAGRLQGPAVPALGLAAVLLVPRLVIL